MPVTVEINNVAVSDLRITKEVFDVYDVEINGTVLNHNLYGTRVEFDGDSDVRVSVDINENELIRIISEEIMIDYLESEGYEVLKK